MKTQIDNWLDENKPSFKEKYGNDWQIELFKAAWDQFGDKTHLHEHTNPVYINKWIDRGFTIDVNDTPQGKVFKVSKNLFKSTIREPSTGEYYVSSAETSFDSFDMAMDYLLKDSMDDDNHVTEQLRILAGIKKG